MEGLERWLSGSSACHRGVRVKSVNYCQKFLPWERCKHLLTLLRSQRQASQGRRQDSSVHMGTSESLALPYTAVEVMNRSVHHLKAATLEGLHHAWMTPPQGCIDGAPLPKSFPDCILPARREERADLLTNALALKPLSSTMLTNKYVFFFPRQGFSV